MKILGIESSCDETAAAILDVTLEDQSTILANQVYSQTEEHIAYGGVVPEIASRAHMERIDNIVKQSLNEASCTMDDIDAIAVTSGPGLLGGLLIGTTFSQSLSIVYNKPLIPTNHLEGHALTAHLTDGVHFPYTLLLVSGGHCQFIEISKSNTADNTHNICDEIVGFSTSKLSYNELGGTLDDAIGECFDKVAKMLGLPYPGGPQIEQRAQQGDKHRFTFPQPLKDGSVNFSFSGLKSAVRREINAIEQLNEQDIADICASFQETVSLILTYKCKKALEVTGNKSFVLAGGVAANKLLREKLNALCNNLNVTFYAPPVKLCTDNAVMIAYAGGLRYLLNNKNVEPLTLKPRWPLASL